MVVDPDLVDIALDRIAGTQFEKFSNMFFPSIIGVDYAPLGGIHDGGADAFGGDVVHERVGRAGMFYQASVQVDAKAKIRATVRRLQEYGRDPKTLTYFTSRRIPTIDVAEDDLGEELGVVVRIKDAGYIRSHINDTAATIADETGEGSRGFRGWASPGCHGRVCRSLEVGFRAPLLGAVVGRRMVNDVADV